MALPLWPGDDFLMLPDAAAATPAVSCSQPSSCCWELAGLMTWWMSPLATVTPLGVVPDGYCLVSVTERCACNAWPGAFAALLCAAESRFCRDRWQHQVKSQELPLGTL